MADFTPQQEDSLETPPDSADGGGDAASRPVAVPSFWRQWWIGVLAMVLVVGLVTVGGLLAGRSDSQASNAGTVPGSQTPTASPTPSSSPGAAAAPVTPGQPAPESPAPQDPEEDEEDEQPAPETPGTQAPPAPAPPAADTTAPVIQQSGASPGVICADPQAGWADVSGLSAVVSDDVGVAGASAAWSGGQVGFGGGGADWYGTFDPPSGTEGTITLSIVAWDAAGNTSGSVSVSVQVVALANCTT